MATAIPLSLLHPCNTQVIDTIIFQCSNFKVRPPLPPRCTEIMSVERDSCINGRVVKCPFCGLAHMVFAKGKEGVSIELIKI